MNSTIDFTLASLMYCLVVVWQYVSHKKIPSFQGSIFNWMLAFGLLSTVLELITTYIDGIDGVVLTPVGYFLNIVFLICAQMAPVLFFMYSTVISGHYQHFTNKIKVLFLIPFEIYAICLIISPMCKAGVFYLGISNIYHQGLTHGMMYVSALIYTVGGILCVFLSRDKIEKQQRSAVYFFIFISIIAIVLQMYFPQYLLTETANVLSLMVIYFAIESPQNHLDSMTGAFNNKGLFIIIQDNFDQRKHFKMLVVTVKNIKNINQQFGRKIGDTVLKEFYLGLQRIFTNNSIARIDGDKYCVILKADRDSEERLKSWSQDFPRSFDIGGGMIDVSNVYAIIDSNDCKSPIELQRTVDYLSQEFQKMDGGLFKANESFYDNYEIRRKQEIALDRAIGNNSIQVYYQPIHMGKNKVKSMEALARLYDDELGFISPDDFIKIAEENGSIIQIGRQIFEKVVQFISTGVLERENIDYVSVNLSVGQCMKEGICRDITEIVNKYNVAPEKICLEITETEAADSMEVVRDTMDEFEANGFSFSLDDFGTGYANFAYIFKFHFKNIKIDKSLLWDAPKDEKKMKLFKAVTRTINDLGLIGICEGVENEGQIKLLTSQGISLHQGFYYSKPLPENKLIEYLRNLRD